MSLKWLITRLERYYNKSVIVLIDEYDAPIHIAYFHGYHQQILNFMRNWLGEGLKDNPSLERGVITGVLLTCKENIFSDLNHASNFTLLSKYFGDKFGLLEEETLPLLLEYGESHNLRDIRTWYNGCHIGSYAAYNPCSIYTIYSTKN